jgi:putative peptide maturation system protein
VTTSTGVNLDELLDYLRRLSVDRARPTEALDRMRRLRERHPRTSLELVWEEEAYDASVHYDLLVRADDLGTASLSYCPDRVQPWPLRGAHRWSDQDLLRVNHTTLPVSQAVACLDFVWDQAPLVERLVNVCLIQEELAREPIDLSEAELQLAMDAFRRARRLATAQDTFLWMQRRGITHTELEALVGDEATIAKLRARIADGQVEPYFRMHQAEFDTAHIARIAFASEAEALAATALARTGVLGFFAVAQSVFTADTLQRPALAAAPTSGPPSAAFEVLQRSRATSPAVEAIFAAGPSEVVGPVWDGHAHILALVLAHTRAQLDASTHATIERVLFDEWLAHRRAQADIEWFWWTTTRTHSPAAPAAA